MLLFLASVLEQLDLALEQLSKGDIHYARFGLMLTDNAVELVLHQLAQDKSKDLKLYAWKREEYAHQKALDKALGRNFEPDYFRLPIDGGDPIYRERVYCYELYHQMRLRWPRDARFTLNGEVDKIAHPILSKLGAAYAKPDLLVHGPGHMSRNHAIIEVKSLMADREGIGKDLNTLQLFRTEVGYERAIHLIYGSGRFNRVLGLVEWCAKEMGLAAPVEVWVHPEPGHPAEKVLDLGGRPEPTGSVTA